MPSVRQRQEAIAQRIAESPNYPRWLLIVTLTGIFATSFPTGILTISIKTIAVDLHSTPSTITWVTTGPILAAAVLTPILGRFGDLRGHRRLFLSGTITAGVFAICTGFAWNAISLIVFRTIAQTGAAATIPSTFAMLFRAFPPHERVRASSLASGSVSGASVIGIVIGGPLIQFFGWRPIFFGQAVIALVAILPALVVLPKLEVAAVKRRVDYPGAATLAIGVFALTFAINRLGVWGPNPISIGCLAAVPFFAVALLLIERHSAAPLLPMQVLKARDTKIVAAASVIINIGWMGNFIVTPLLLQSVIGLSVVWTALSTLPRTGGIVVASPFAGRIGVRWGERKLLVSACLILVLIMCLLSYATIDKSLALLLIALTLSGLAFGAASPALVSSMSRGVAEEDFGLAVSLQQTSNQIGAVIGISLASAIAADATTPGPFAIVYLLTAVLMLVVAAIGYTLTRPAAEPAVAAVAAVTS